MLNNIVVEKARDWVGTPYHHQGSLKQAGTDCLGLIRGLWRELYDGAEPEIPPVYSQHWGEFDPTETLLLAAQRNLEVKAVAAEGSFVVNPRSIHWEPGAIIVLRRTPNVVAKHCAIVSTSERIIHAYSGVGVRETSVGIWDKHVAGIFRFPGY